MRLTRRQTLLMGTAASVFPFHFWKKEDEAKPVGWAVLGIGYYAQNLIMPAFEHCERSKLVGLISGHPDKLVRFGEKYGIASTSRYIYDTMAGMRDNPEIEVVYVITPPALHPEYSVRAAKLGKHVCSEKPMAPTVADCQKMIDACRSAGKLLQIGYRSQYEAHNLRAIKACRSGEFGKIKSIRSDHGFDIAHGTWRTEKALAGGGSMMDIGIYSLQALRYLSGEEPVEVSATITNPPNDDRFKDVEDTAKFSLIFPSGLVGHGSGGYSWNPGKNRYEVEFDKGAMLAEPATPYDGHRLTFNGKDMELVPNNQFAAQIEQMSACIRDGGKVKTPGQEGQRDIRIVQAIYESARTGKAVSLG